MRKSIFAFALVLLVCCAGQSQETTPNQATTAPAESRYEIIQSTIAAKSTFKLDKIVGTVYLLVEKRTGGLTWQSMVVESAPYDTKVSGKVNYQIFTSGISMRYTFLLNVNTGVTWVLSEDIDTKELFWKPM